MNNDQPPDIQLTDNEQHLVELLAHAWASVAPIVQAKAKEDGVTIFEDVRPIITEAIFMGAIGALLVLNGGRAPKLPAGDRAKIVRDMAWERTADLLGITKEA